MPKLDFITERRSIRRFTSEDIDNETLDKLLASVRWAPSWANSQCGEIIVVKRQDLKDKLKDTLTKRNPAIMAVQNAPVVLALCARLGKAGYYSEEAMTKFGDWFMFDIGLATQNLVLTAHLLGLGSVIVGGMDQDKARGILSVPEGVELVCLLPIGYPDHEPSPPPRREAEDFTHYELF